MTKDTKSGGPDGGEQGSTRDESALPERLRDLDSRLSTLQSSIERTESDKARRAGNGAAYGRALKHVSEFVGGTMAGLMLGWLVDWFVGSFPVGLIVGLILGFVTGFWNIYKSSMRSGES